LPRRNRPARVRTARRPTGRARWQPAGGAGRGDARSVSRRLAPSAEMTVPDLPRQFKFSSPNCQEIREDFVNEQLCDSRLTKIFHNHFLDDLRRTPGRTPREGRSDEGIPLKIRRFQLARTGRSNLVRRRPRRRFRFGRMRLPVPRTAVTVRRTGRLWGGRGAAATLYRPIRAQAGPATGPRRPEI
jgi:hypothetical protein